MNPFDFVKLINNGKGTVPEDIEDYVPFLTNRAMSQHIDTLLLAQDMNRYHELPKRQQFCYYASTVRPKKRYGTWHKSEKDEDVDFIQTKFSCNRKRAKEIKLLLTKEQIASLKDQTPK